MKKVLFAVIVMFLSLFLIIACADDETGSDDDGDSDSRLSESDGDADGDFSESGDADRMEYSDELEDSEDGDSDDSEDTPELKWPGCDDRLPTQKITFLHVNDIHSEYSTYEGDQYGSNVARIIGYYRQVRAENPFTVFTNGGDDHEKGSVAEQLSEGYSTVEVIKAMKFDVRVVGNHDFAWGEEELLDYANDPHGITLASNTKYVGENPSAFAAVEYAELQIGCARVGFFGMTPKPYNEKNQQYEGDFYPGGNFRTTYNYAEIAEAIITEHRKSVDIMVMVSHLGHGEDKTLAGEVEGIDIILGGHSHTAVYQPAIINGTIIVQSGSDALFVGRLDVDVDVVHGKIVSHAYSLDMNLPFMMPLDDEFQNTLMEIMQKWAPGAFDAVGYVYDNRNYPEIGAITANAVKSVLGVDAALLDIDEIWEKWMIGKMSRQDMLDSFQVERQPAGSSGFNSFYTADIGGADLLLVRDGMGDKWSFIGPESIDENVDYKLALQKHAAFNPADYLPDGVSIADVEAADETWRLLDSYASSRTANCLYVDVDLPLPDCGE